MVEKGLVMSLAIGVAALIITTIVAFVVVQNVATVDDDISTAIAGVRVTNETLTAVNGTTYTVAKASTTGFGGFTVIRIWNGTEIIGSGNYTAGSAGTIVGTAGRTLNYTTGIKIIYDWTHKPTEGTGDRMITNFTSGVDNIGNKIPTILLIAAVVLILGILGLLWTQYKKMDIGSGSSL